jgi:biopolymer transport protein ExbB
MLKELFQHAGVVAWPLGLASIIALAIILERFYTLAKLARIEKLAAEFLANNGPVAGAALDPKLAAAPIARVAASMDQVRGAHPDLVASSADIAIGLQRLRLRKYLGTLATIGSTSPFVGLFGTVLGVIAAFEEMSKNQLTGEKMSGGISEALSATALGLLVAIPAVIFYNFMVGKVNGFVLNIQADVARIMPNYAARDLAVVETSNNGAAAVRQKQEA